MSYSRGSELKEQTMQTTPGHSLAAAILVAMVCWATPAQAAKPEWAGGPHGKGHADADKHSVQVKEHGHDGKKQKHAGGAQAVTIGGYFGEPQRSAARSYYYDGGRRGGKACPPGLAKKNNGCMPPGQARKWSVGQPLPREVVYYPVPQQLVVSLGTPPAGYRYVRVAADILLIAVGTHMVVDGIQDLIR
jgi:Ni/Co efflux regulator RcnB